MSEAQRSALSALLLRTGDQSKGIVLALATNRPGDLVSAVSDRIEEVLQFSLLREAASKTVGYSGREIAKLMASVQADVYGSRGCILDPLLLREVIDYKVAEHQQRMMLTNTDGNDTQKS